MQHSESLNMRLGPRTSRSLSGRRRWTSAVMTGITAACALFTASLLLIILGYIAVRGVASLNLQFLIDTPKPVGEGGGIGNAILGSFLMTGLGSVVGLPIG